MLGALPPRPEDCVDNSGFNYPGCRAVLCIEPAGACFNDDESRSDQLLQDYGTPSIKEGTPQHSYIHLKRKRNFLSQVNTRTASFLQISISLYLDT